MDTLFLVLLINIIGFEQDIEFGTYKFKNENIREVLTLNSDMSFKYEFDGHFLHYDLEGSWTTHNDSLILNSIPQRDRLVVKESKRLFSKKYSFKVKNKNQNRIGYHLHLFGVNGEKLVLRDQWKSSKVKVEFKLSSFFLEDSKGLKSPLYKVDGDFSNTFNILFESKRVFEKEIWLIKESQIIPNTITSQRANYGLVFTLH